MFKLSISNIAWTVEHDHNVYSAMKSMEFKGVEIAPNRVFPTNPYANTVEARMWSDSLFEEYGLIVPSIQAIWYGRTESLFGSDKEREILMCYTKRDLDVRKTGLFLKV